VAQDARPGVSAARGVQRRHGGGLVHPALGGLHGGELDEH
jgi:hypothetical protein